MTAHTAPRLSPVSPLPAASGFPLPERPRRLRRTAAIRRLVRETRLYAADLVLPVFVKEGLTEGQPISAMPGVVQHPLADLPAVADEAARAGLGGLMVFGIPAARDAVGTAATEPDGILNAAIAAVRREVGDDIVLMADLCLDEFTDHGHCGVLTASGAVDNDATLLRYQEMGIALAEAGADVVGTSGMMDGQVGAVRGALDAA